VDAQNLNYSSVEGVLFDKNRAVLVKYPQGKQGRSYTIPAGVTAIGDYAFAMCTGLTGVTIPASVTSIGNNEFSGCSSLTSIIVATQNNAYSSVEGVLLNKNKTVLIAYPAGKQGSYTIPAGVTSIGEYAFYGTNLTSISIPNSVTSIGDNAFYHNQLISLTLPNSVTTIGAQAFASNQLTSVTIGANVRIITEWLRESFGESKFGNAYEYGGKRAGTYTRPNTNITTWTNSADRRADVVESDNESTRSGDGVLSELVGMWSSETSGRPVFFIGPSSWSNGYSLQFQGGNDGYDISVSQNTLTISMGDSIAATFDYSISNGKMTIANLKGGSYYFSSFLGFSPHVLVKGYN